MTFTKLLEKRVQASRVHAALFLMMMVWGLNLSAVKVLTETLDVMLVASVRMTMASLVMGVIALSVSLERPSTGSFRWHHLFIAGFFLVYCQQIAFAEGLRRTSATNAALVMALGPAISLLLEAFTFGRRLHLLQFLGIAASLLGVAVVVLNRPLASITGAAWGDAWILCSVVAFAVGGLMVQRMTRTTSAMRVTFGVHVVGTALLWCHVGLLTNSPMTGILEMGARQWGMAGFSAVFATGLGALVWSKGISTIGVGRTASYLSWVPIFGVCFGAVFLAEPVTLWLLVGLCGVFLGSVLVARS